MRRHATVPQADALSRDRVSRSHILRAARAEFAVHGLAGARVASIAAAAKVNKQLIYYYYGSKVELYRAALEAAYVEIRTLEQDLNLVGLPPEQALAALVAFSFDYLHEHPDFIDLINHENANGAHHVASFASIQATNSPLISLLRDTLLRGVLDKVFRPGVDPVELYISIAGMSYFFFSNNRTLSSIFGIRLQTKRRLGSYRRHVIDFTLAALRPA